MSQEPLEASGPHGGMEQRWLVYVVDPDEDATRPAIEHLEAVGFTVRDFGTGAELVAALMRVPTPAAVVLELTLPDMPGTVLCSAVRDTAKIPVLLTSSSASPADRLAGLAAGADEFLAKPLVPEEVAFLLRRAIARATERPSVLLVGAADVTLDPAGYRLIAGDDEIQLTPRELEVFGFLLSRKGEFCSAQQIAAIVWGHPTYTDANIVQAHISRIRSKLRAIGIQAERVIRTQRGVGYIIPQDK